MPGWLPLWLLVLNTFVVVDGALAAAIWLFFLRRAGNKRVAALALAAGLVLVGGLELLAWIDVLAASIVVVDIAVAAAIWWFFVRRAGNRRRASVVLAVGLVLVGGLERLAWIESSARPIWRTRDFDRSRDLRFHFGWGETPILGRHVRPHIFVIFARWYVQSIDKISPRMAGQGLDQTIPGDRVHVVDQDNVLGNNLRDRSRDDGRTLDDRARALFHDLWPFHDRPDTAETRADLWRAFMGSELVRSDPRLVSYLEGR